MVIGGAVLAGGRSTRMGTDKALIQRDGRYLAEAVAALLGSCGCSPVCVVGRQANLADLGWPLVASETGDHHPLLGIAAALECISTEMTLFAPCDLINLQAWHVEAMLAHGEPCVAWSGDQVQPLLAVIPTSMAGTARRLAAEGAPAKALTGSLDRINLGGPLLIDANRPSDLVR